MGQNLIFSRISIPIVPVCIFENVASALAVSQLAFENGFETLEVTLRTEDAFACLESIRREFPEILLGAGTVFHRQEVDRLVDLGISYGVSPCFDRSLVEYALSKGLEFIPGVATPTELRSALEVVSNIKIFPAQALGGVAFIGSLRSPFSSFQYGLIPTGGIGEKNFTDYLEFDNVQACGMTWPVDRELLAQDDFKTVEKRLKYIYREAQL